jgi:Zn-dependent protease with chaperone function
MLTTISGAYVLAVLVALSPAVLRWSWGHPLARLVDDPAFPERLVAHRRRSNRSCGIALVLLIAGWLPWIWWTIPLTMLACAVGGFRLRRLIYGETWSLPQYLSFFTRLVVTMFGFWVLLASAPAVALAADRNAIAMAVTLTIVLLLWNWRAPDILRALLRTRPVDDPALVARFTALAQRCDTRMPRFERVDLHGGVIANAVALPSFRQPSVIFTDTLLARLDADAIVAICAHELAHLEHFNPRWLRQLNTITLALIAGALGTVLAARMLGPSWAWPQMLWPVAVVVAMAFRARGRQQHETESDLRAVALTGDGEALARGLTQIHAYAHVPRRVDSALEQNATHPSLARRIKAIRGANATPPPALATDVRIIGADRGADRATEVAFLAERLEWREGDAAMHALSYGHLSELRLDAGPSGPPRLIVVERGGRRWEMALEAADVARTQAVLDLVDGRLAEPLARNTANAWMPARQLVIVVIGSMALLGTQLGAALVAMLAFARPIPPLMAALGGAALGAAAFVFRDIAQGSDFTPEWTGFALLAAGLFTLWSGWTSRREQYAAKDLRLVAALALATALAVLTVFIDGASITHLHQNARGMPASTVLPLALGAGLLVMPRRRMQAGGAVAIALGLTAAAFSSLAFLDRFGGDPLLASSATITRVSLNDDDARQFPLPFYAAEVQLSPGGTHVALREAGRGYDDDDRTPKFQVGRLGGELSPITADDFIFLDDERGLAIRNRDEGTEIRELILVPKPAIVWSVDVPDVHRATLSARGHAGEWRLLGWDPAQQIVRVAGRVESNEMETTRWAVPAMRSAWPVGVAASGSEALLLENHYDSFMNGGLLPWSYLIRIPMPSMRIWRVGNNALAPVSVSDMETQCFPDVLGEDALACSVFDGTRTHLVSIDVASGRATPLGMLYGRFAAHGRAPRGWITGWCDTRMMALRVSTRDVFEASQRTVAIAATDRWFGAVTYDGSNSAIRLFPLGEESRASR